VEVNTSSSSTDTEDGDVIRIASKLRNVLLNPAQSHHLVLQAVVATRLGVFRTQETLIDIEHIKNYFINVIPKR
jgi:hypothetical protein